MALWEFTKDFDNDGNQFTANPHYNANYQHTIVVLSYEYPTTTKEQNSELKIMCNEACGK